MVAGVGVARWQLGDTLPTSAAARAPHVPPSGVPTVMTAATKVLPPPTAARVPLPGNGILTRLPGQGDLLALTVDDGANSDVVRMYTQFAKDTGVRLTYFVNGMYRSWTDNAALLRPLVDSRQIQLGNHTWSHPDLTTVSAHRMADEITRNERFLKKTFGIDAAPYLRPPYGSRNPAVDRVAADLGYRTVALWSGSLADSTVVTEDFIVKMAQQYFTPQTIVLGHLNHLPVTHVYGHLVDLIRSRKLRTVTLDDVFLRPGRLA
ncbi:MAG TPA: polysaccharide deacetylase family protein [Mycobacterium sp.]|nr:polysaccharide deacetylase family protein [Mycobacterium sp.]